MFSLRFLHVCLGEGEGGCQSLQCERCVRNEMSRASFRDPVGRPVPRRAGHATARREPHAERELARREGDLRHESRGETIELRAHAACRACVFRVYTQTRKRIADPLRRANTRRAGERSGHERGGTATC